MPANFMLLYGGKPGVIVSAETKFITDIMSNIERLYDKPTQTIDIPHIFDFLEGSDTNIEIVVSSMLQATKLGIRNFPAIKSKSFIFVQEKIVAKRDDYNDPLVYPKAKERADKTKEFFEKDMQFTAVEVCMNLTKDEMVEKFQEIQKECSEFEEQHKADNQGVFGVYIVYIGYYISATQHDEIDYI